MHNVPPAEQLSPIIVVNNRTGITTVKAVRRNSD